MNQHAEPLAPLVKKVTVPLTPEAAFRRFTEQMASWWPLETHSVGEKNAETVEFGRGVGGQIVEHLTGGRTSVWGTVLSWDPPHSVSFTWHPGREPNDNQRVVVEFSDRGGETEVVLTHSGWEFFGESAAEYRSNYDSGWDRVLGLFVAAAHPTGEAAR